MTNHEPHLMQYNSQKGLLSIPEYGRNVQNMIAYAKTVDDLEKRQRIVEGVIKLMMQMNPHNKNLADYKQRLWKHLFHIADYDLEVQVPEGIIITRKEEDLKPEPMGYPAYETRYRHYGHQVQILIKKAIEMEDEEKKAEFVRVIAAYMKLAYRTWNQNANINDNIIKSDLKEISDKQLEMSPDEPINYLASSYTKPKRPPQNTRSNNNRGKKKQYKKKRR